MEEYSQRQEKTAKPLSASQTPWWLAVSAVLLVATGLAFGYGYRQHAKVDQMASQANQMSATINQLQAQIKSLNSKLNEMSTPTSAVAPVASVPVPVIAPPKTKPVVSSIRWSPPDESLSDRPRLQDGLLRELQRKQFDGAVVVQSQ